MLCVAVWECAYHTCVGDHAPCPVLQSYTRWRRKYKLQILLNFLVFEPCSKINKYMLYIYITTRFRVIHFNCTPRPKGIILQQQVDLGVYRPFSCTQYTNDVKELDTRLFYNFYIDTPISSYVSILYNIFVYHYVIGIHN